MNVDVWIAPSKFASFISPDCFVSCLNKLNAEQGMKMIVQEILCKLCHVLPCLVLSEGLRCMFVAAMFLFAWEFPLHSSNV